MTTQDFPRLKLSTVIPKLDRIFAAYGVPKVVKSDNGPPFNGGEFAQFAKYLGFKHRKVTMYNYETKQTRSEVGSQSGLRSEICRGIEREHPESLLHTTFQMAIIAFAD